jgi:energy-coupling factor transporter ATP-binding protein EcfA2
VRAGASVTAVAATLKVREQHIAVFGASGSGKTVLVSSFYGAAQEQSFLKESLFRVSADNTGHGTRLLKNYLGMKNSAVLPVQDRFAATAFSFTIKPKDQGEAKPAKSKPFDAVRLVWHDYPGEWFEEEPSSEEEAARRIEAFRKLLSSDVAIVLVDGQELLDHQGEEEKYLKSLFWMLRDGLLRLKDGLLDDGEPLIQFPRIWMLALSKSDLHPNLDVHGFRDLVIEKAGDDVTALHEAVQELVQLPEALSIGEDFLLLSSARFDPGRIEVTKRVGLDLLLPVATLLPLERLVQWSERLDLPLKALNKLSDNAQAIATALVGAAAFKTLLGKVPKVGPLLSLVAFPALISAATLTGAKIKEINANARATKEILTAILTQFRLDLDRGVEDDVLLKSDK